MTLRRFAAVQLIQMATGMLFEEAACFLGIPTSALPFLGWWEIIAGHASK
ncbi:hypothetical protein [Streptomyces olivochromogenes]